MWATNIAPISNDPETFYQIFAFSNPMIMSGEWGLIDITEGGSTCWWMRGTNIIIWIRLEVYSSRGLRGFDRFPKA